ncbi:MAG: hypothetical protein ACREP9_19295 [Candidatus Dormibacteraceae bacterium]
MKTQGPQPFPEITLKKSVVVQVGYGSGSVPTAAIVCMGLRR